MVYWLGWIVYGASLVLAVGYAALFILVSIVAVGADPFANLATLAALLVPALIVSGIGRDVCLPGSNRSSFHGRAVLKAGFGRHISMGGSVNPIQREISLEVAPIRIAAGCASGLYRGAHKASDDARSERHR